MNYEAEQEADFPGLSVQDQRIIARAAILAYGGRHAEAEVVRFAARYHNLKEVPHQHHHS